MCVCARAGGLMESCHRYVCKLSPSSAVTLFLPCNLSHFSRLIFYICLFFSFPSFISLSNPMISHPFGAVYHMWMCYLKLHIVFFFFFKTEKKANNVMLGWVIQLFLQNLCCCLWVVVILFISLLSSFSYSSIFLLCFSTCVPFKAW